MTCGHDGETTVSPHSLVTVERTSLVTRGGHHGGRIKRRPEFDEVQPSGRPRPRIPFAFEFYDAVQLHFLPQRFVHGLFFTRLKELRESLRRRAFDHPRGQRQTLPIIGIAQWCRRQLPHREQVANEIGRPVLERMPQIRHPLLPFVRRFAQHGNAFIRPGRERSLMKSVGQDDVREFMGQGGVTPVGGIAAQINATENHTVAVKLHARRSHRSIAGSTERGPVLGEVGVNDNLTRWRPHSRRRVFSPRLAQSLTPMLAGNGQLARRGFARRPAVKVRCLSDVASGLLADTHCDLYRFTSGYHPVPNETKREGTEKQSPDPLGECCLAGHAEMARGKVGIGNSPVRKPCAIVPTPHRAGCCNRSPDNGLGVLVMQNG